MKIELVFSFIALVCSVVALYQIHKSNTRQKKLSMNLAHATFLDTGKPVEGPAHPLPFKIREIERSIVAVYTSQMREKNCMHVKLGSYEMVRKANDSGTLNVMIDVPANSGYPWAMGYVVYEEGRREEHRRMVIPDQTGWGFFHMDEPYRVSLCLDPEEWQGADCLHLYIYNVAKTPTITCGWPEKKETQVRA